MKSRGIEFSSTELEYYDKKDIVKPALKLHKPKINIHHQKYASILNDSFHLKNYYYKHGLIELPQEHDFTPWKDYKDGFENKVGLYYHPYQLVAIRPLTMGNNITLSAEFLEFVQDQDIQSYLKQWKDTIAKNISASQNTSKIGYFENIIRVACAKGLT